VKKGSTYTPVVRKPEGKRRLVGLRRDGIILLKWIIHN
jgi:hypothetical protein